ncbi:MAG: hypothetical protein R3E85_08615 [Planctomycetota bacterium]
MGLDASVGCNCMRDGKAKPCPVGPVLLGEEGYWQLDLPWESHQREHVAFDVWRRTACEHEDMDAAGERVANWSGVSLFREALHAVGAEKFPALLSELPSANGGQTDAAACATILAELERFECLETVRRGTFLVNSETGDRLHEYVAAHEGVIVLCGRSGLDAGFDPHGVFIREREGRELFRAQRVAQRLLDPGRTRRHKGGRAEFTNLETGERAVLKITISGRIIPYEDGSWTDRKGRVRSEYPSRLHVEEQDEVPADFAYITAPLRKLCEAALATGNPIRWA